jgi:hypothetical protein
MDDMPHNGNGIGSGPGKVHNWSVYLCFVEDEIDHDIGVPVDPDGEVIEVGASGQQPSGVGDLPFTIL